MYPHPNTYYRDTHDYSNPAETTQDRQQSFTWAATRSQLLYATLGCDLRSYTTTLGIHPTRSIEAVSHLALRPKLLRETVRKRILQYEATTDPVKKAPSAQPVPRTQCPYCHRLFITTRGLQHHQLRWHPDDKPTVPEVRRILEGVKPRGFTKRGLAMIRPPRGNQASSWSITGTECPTCRRRFNSVHMCREHWTNVCSKPQVRKCAGCQLVNKAYVKASRRPGANLSCLHVPKALRRRARQMHTCNKDPTTAPLYVKYSLGKQGKRCGIPKPVLPPPPAPALGSAVVPTLRYPLLPPTTVRKFIRPRVRLGSGKYPLYAKPYRVLRKVAYRALPSGWQWPTIPSSSDLPWVRRKKKKKPIPPEVLAEMRQWRNATRTKSHSTSPSMLAEHADLHPDDEAAFAALQELDDPAQEEAPSEPFEEPLPDPDLPWDQSFNEEAFVSL
jgi:hypothetical protein